jgi:hypothetical protein
MASIDEYSTSSPKRSQRRGDRIEIRKIPVRQAAIMQKDGEHILVENAFPVDLYGRRRDALLVNGSRIGGQRARDLAAHIGHVAEHRRPRDEPAMPVDGHEHEPIVRMADRAAHRVRVIREENIALLDGTVIALHEAPDERAELADHHFSRRVGDHRKLVVLLADAGRHRRSK